MRVDEHGARGARHLQLAVDQRRPARLEQPRPDPPALHEPPQRLRVAPDVRPVRRRVRNPQQVDQLGHDRVLVRVHVRTDRLVLARLGTETRGRGQDEQRDGGRERAEVRHGHHREVGECDEGAGTALPPARPGRRAPVLRPMWRSAPRRVNECDAAPMNETAPGADLRGRSAMPRAGLEPAWAQARSILSRVRLPIPPPRRPLGASAPHP